jgi:hypothetical protein
MYQKNKIHAFQLVAYTSFIYAVFNVLVNGCELLKIVSAHSQSKNTADDKDACWIWRGAPMGNACSLNLARIPKRQSTQRFYKAVKFLQTHWILYEAYNDAMQARIGIYIGTLLYIGVKHRHSSKESSRVPLAPMRCCGFVK